VGKAFTAKCHLSEEKYWWFVARRNFIALLINRMNLDFNSKILDVGCSEGGLIQILENKGFTSVSGIDVSEQAIAQCALRGINKVSLKDGINTDFKDGEFDLIIASDVLEHIADERSALKEWCRILTPQGILLLFVPAFKTLWSSNDELNNHYRRYDKSYLINQIVSANFEIQRMSYWNSALFLPIFFQRTLERNLPKKTIKKKDELYYINPFLNNLLGSVLKIENFFLSYFNAPVGVSLFAICKK